MAVVRSPRLAVLRTCGVRLALVGCLLPLVLLTAYNQPYWDDYSCAALCRRLGALGSISYLYRHIGGRFISNLFFTVGNPLSYNWMGGVKLVALLAIAGHLACIYVAVRTFTGKRMPRQQAGWVSMALWLTFVFTIPDIHSGVYWFAGLVVHQLACCLLLLVPAAVARASQAPTAKARWLLAAALGTGTMAGTSELGVWLLSLVLLLGAAKSLWDRQWRQLAGWAGLLLLLGGSFAVALLAPGNYERLATAPAMPQSLLTLAAQVGPGLRLVLWQPVFFALLLVPILFAPVGAALLPFRPKGMQLPLLLGAAVVLAGIVGGVAMLSITIGPQLLARGVNVLYWWTLFGWLAACWASLPAAGKPYGSFSPAVRLLVGGLLLVVFAAPVRRAWQEALYEAPAWAAQSEARIPIYLKHRGQHVKLIVPPIVHVQPRYVLVRGYDIQPYYLHPLNTSTASYFNLDSVKIDASWPVHAAF